MEKSSEKNDFIFDTSALISLGAIEIIDAVLISDISKDSRNSFCY